VRFDRLIELARTTPPAVVLQSSYANGLGVIRDLGREGVPVVAADPNRRALGFVSRYAAGVVVPDPADDEEEFVAGLEALGRELPRRAVLFPTHDEYVWAVSRHAERLQPLFRVPFSSWETMHRVADKEEQLRAAWRAGVDTPATQFVRDAADLEEVASRTAFPAIFKPVASLAFKRRFGRPVLVIPTRDELLEVYRRVDDCGPLMLQEIVPGGDDELYTVGSYLDAASRPLAIFTGRKLRQHPRTFGTCRFAESVWLPELAEAAVRLLTELRFHGVSQVEFKRDHRDGRYKLMEVNARHWLWHALATRCGVNLSLAAYRDAVGEPSVSPLQSDDARWILSLKDTADSLLEIRRGELTAKSWLGSLGGTRIDGVLALDDPVPGLVNTARWTRLAWRRLRHRREARREELEL